MTSLHDPLLTIDEAAELLGTGPSLPLRLIAEGHLDHVSEGDSVRIPQSALIAYVIGAPGRPMPCQDEASATATETPAA